MHMMNNKVLAPIAMLAVLAALFYAYSKYPWGLVAPAALSYSSEQYGITFTYPDTYALQERELGNGERWHHAIVLVDKAWLANIPEGGEGPPALSVDIYQNDLDQLPIENWIRDTNASNFKLSIDGRLAEVQVAGSRALYYRWDGLYRGESYALAHKGNIVVFSATYNATDDQIRKDFAQVLSSVSLY